MHRLHRGLCAANVDSRIHCLTRQTADPRVTTMAERPAAEAGAERVISARVFEARMARAKVRMPATTELFSLPAWRIGHDTVEQIPRASVINLHWVSRFLDLPRFFAWAAGQRIPVVWTLHDMNPFTGGCHYDQGCGRFRDLCGACPQIGSSDPADLATEMQAARMAAYGPGTGALRQIVTPSQWLADEVRRSAVLGHVPVSVIPYGLPHDTYVPGDRQALRAGLGLPQDRATVLLAAQDLHNRRKGSGVAIEALRRLPAATRPLVVTLGNGLLEAPDLDIHAVGNIPETDDSAAARVFAAVDAVLVPSLQDNLPNVVIEAMACGTAVVGSRVGGIPDMVSDGHSGRLVPPDDPVALADTLADLLADPRRLHAMGESGRALVERRHTLVHQAAAYESLYAALLGTPPPRYRSLPPDPFPLAARASGFSDLITVTGAKATSWPRRLPGRVAVANRSLRFADLHSLHHQLREVMGDGIYDLHPGTDAAWIIDAGAHVGVATLRFAERFPGARIDALEADPAIADMLRQNVAAFGLMQVRVHAAAAWTHADGVPLAITADDSGHVTHDASSRLVPSLRLRDLIAAGARPVDLLKLDIEGAEFPVISDCAAVLGQVRHMVIEVHQMQGHQPLGALISALEQAGFRIVLRDLRAATWLPVRATPFPAVPTDRHLALVYAWRAQG